jgi:DNA invertase Pin-like site-specific DNA recombinase
MTQPDNSVARITQQIAALERQLRIMKAERAAHILNLRKAGQSLATIANAAGLTRQRILQISQKYEAKNAAR